MNALDIKVAALQDKVEMVDTPCDEDKDLRCAVKKVKAGLEMVKPWVMEIRKRNIDTWIRGRGPLSDTPAERPDDATQRNFTKRRV